MSHCSTCVNYGLSRPSYQELHAISCSHRTNTERLSNMSKESEPVSSRAGAGDSLVNLAHYLFPITPCNTVLAFFQRPRSSQPKFDFTFLEKMKKVYLKNILPDFLQHYNSRVFLVHTDSLCGYNKVTMYFIAQTETHLGVRESY